MFTLLTVADLIEVLEGVRSLLIEEHLGVFITVASMLSAFLAAWAYIRISHDYMEGQGITFWMFLKPLVMVILITNFNTFILHPVHVMTSLFTNDLTLRTNEAQSSWSQSMSNIWHSVQESGFNPIKTTTLDAQGQEETDNASSPGAPEKEDPTFWERCKKFFGSVTAAWSNYHLSLHNIKQLGLSTGIYSLLRLIMHIVYYCQLCICYILLTIYGLLGPFVFAFSILGNYSRGVGDWIARYIQTSFWIPVGQIIMLISATIMDNINNVINFNVGDIQINQYNGILGNFNIGAWLGVIMIIATCACIFQVPKICSYIIESTGSAGVAQGVGGAAGRAAATAARVITKV